MNLDQMMLWSTATRFHDWSSGEFPQRLYATLERCGAIGEPAWMQLPRRKRQKARGRPASEFAAFARSPACLDSRGHPSFTLGGSTPAGEWEASWRIDGWDAEERRVEGYSMINVRFRIADQGPSTSLIEAFSSVYDEDATEYASIHPSVEASDLGGLDGPYRDVLVLGPMLAGIYWANFLGPGHAELFDLAALASIDAAVVRVTERSFLLVVSESLADATDPAFRSRLIPLNDRFRAALHHRPRGSKV